MGNHGGKDENQSGNAGKPVNQGRNAENSGGNKGNKGENLRIGVKLTN